MNSPTLIAMVLLWREKSGSRRFAPKEWYSFLTEPRPE